ncbi:hypothetical protein MKX03_032202 [Papaver bracteatum]|nr:hypothetical protein MKX03_032202 [Papaver bracteatum]
MKKGDRVALQPYFKRTTPSDFAWRLIDHDGGVSFSVLGAHELLQSNDEDGVNEYIRDFILPFPDDVTELFILIFTTSASHWTLLHFNFSDHRWKHYNSLSDIYTKKACKTSAKLMMDACMLPIRQRNMNH